MMLDNIKFIEELSKAEQIAALLAESCRELKSDISNGTSSAPPFKIADNEKGTVAQLLWLIAKVAPITDKDGNYLTNTEEAAKKMGMALFGESFPNWSQTLHAAFDREKGFDFEKKIQKIIAEKKDSMR